jgi:hypothetical protein
MRSRNGLRGMLWLDVSAVGVVGGDLLEPDFWTASQNCSQVPSERTQLAE